MPRTIFALHNDVHFCFQSCILSLMLEEKGACVPAAIVKVPLLKMKENSSNAKTYGPTGPGP